MLSNQSKFLISKILNQLPARHFARRIIQPNVVKIISQDEPNIGPSIDPPEFSKNPKLFDEGFAQKIPKSKPQDSRLSKYKPPKIEFDNIKYEKNDHTKVFSEAMIESLLKRSSNLMLLEGKRLINDALSCSGTKLHYIFFSRKQDLADIANLEEVVQEHKARLTKVTYREIKVYSPLKTPPGLMAIVERPTEETVKANQSKNLLPLILICDQIRDPGNLGTILRTATASGVPRVILTEGTVDPFNQKVIKSAAGAHFRLLLEPKIHWDDILNHLPEQFDLFLADSRPDSVLDPDLEDQISLNEQDLPKSITYYEVDYFSNQKPKILVIGNEAFGLSRKCHLFSRQFSDCKRLQIPLYSNTESLNSAMANSILLYEFRKQFNLKNS